MAGIDDELARFEKEIAAVEAAQPEEGQITTQVVMSAPAQNPHSRYSSNVNTSVSRAPEPYIPPPPASQNHAPQRTVPLLESSYYKTHYEPPPRYTPQNLPRDIYGNFYDPSLMNRNKSYDYGGSEGKPVVKDKSDSNVKELAKTIVPKTTVFRKAAGGTGLESWVDTSLVEWPENDFRIFVGDLGNEVSDDMLIKCFQRYKSFNKAKVVRDSKSGKNRGYGFVSLGHWEDYAKAMKEMNGKYCGNRPMKLRKSNWKERLDENPNRKVMKKAKKTLAEKQVGIVTGPSRAQETSNEPKMPERVQNSGGRYRSYTR